MSIPANVLHFQLNSSTVKTTVPEPMDIQSHKEDSFNLEQVFLNMGLIEQASDRNTPLTFHFIRNNDGSIRWIWPNHVQSPLFLKFYSLGNFKSRIFALGAQLFFLFKLGKFFKHGSKSISGYSFTELGLLQWALFTGTIGPNRKAIAFVDEQDKSRFIKLPLSEKALLNLKSEHNALIQLSESGAKEYFHFPEPVISPRQEIFTQTALPVAALNSSNLPTQLNLNRFVDWQSKSISNEPLSILRATPKADKFSEKFLLLIQQLDAWCMQHPISITTANHGDFTPWNCKMLNEQLYIFDWEMFEAKGLPLGDLFHFVYQQGILVDRLSIPELRIRISDLLSHPAVIDFLETNKLNPLHLELHYLQRVCSYYLGVYSEQENWHLQVNWLLSTWESSIERLLKMASNDSRAEVLRDFQKVISQFDCALLKFSLSTLDQLPLNSDIDLCASKAAAKQIRHFFESHPATAKVHFKNLYKMHQLEILLLDGSRIDMDLIFKFRRKWVEYVDAKQVLTTRVFNNNQLPVASMEMNSLYVERFYALNKSEVPEKHQHWLLSKTENNKMNQVEASVLQLPFNRGIKALMNRMAYLFEMIKSMKQKKGFLITFSGVDGAGKSTIIETVKQELEKQHRRRVVVIRHRPSLLPIISAWKYGKKGAEERSVSTLPRQGKNSGRLSSLFRFMYYLSDYVLGQWWIYFRYVRKGVIVLYDRYYFDFINDSRRSNIALSPAFTERFYTLIRKPEFNFFLWASSEVILKRKQELDKQTIEGLTAQYSQLFDRLQKRDASVVYRCIENLEIGATVGLIMRNVSKKLHESPVYSNHSPEKP